MILSLVIVHLAVLDFARQKHSVLSCFYNKENAHSKALEIEIAAERYPVTVLSKTSLQEEFMKNSCQSCCHRWRRYGRFVNLPFDEIRLAGCCSG